MYHPPISLAVMSKVSLLLATCTPHIGPIGWCRSPSFLDFSHLELHIIQGLHYGLHLLLDHLGQLSLLVLTAAAAARLRSLPLLHSIVITISILHKGHILLRLLLSPPPGE